MSEQYTSSFGIYAIENAYTGALYVGGTTKSFNVRWQAHRNGLNSGNHHSQLLQDAWNKHGESVFVFRILEVVEDRLLVPYRERFWMEELQPAYNSSYIAIGYGTETPRKSSGITYRQTVSEALYAAMEKARGSRSVQDFTADAIRSAIEGSPTERALRSEIARLHQTIRSFAGVLAHQPAPLDETHLTWD